MLWDNEKVSLANKLNSIHAKSQNSISTAAQDTFEDSIYPPPLTSKLTRNLEQITEVIICFPCKNLQKFQRWHAKFLQFDLPRTQGNKKRKRTHKN